MSIKKTVLLMLFAGCAIVPVWAADEAAGAAAASAKAGPSAFDQFLDSVGITQSELEAKANSTKMFGGSSPVSFSGEGRVKLQYHNLTSDEPWTVDDRSYLSSGWEGNESMIRMGMVVRPGRNTVLYGKIGFQSTLPGNRWRPPTNSDVNGTVAPYLHDKSLISANIHEDMNAGFAVRTVPASFWLRMGNINWVEASPFTIWKAQPRTFAWEYLPYEVEQPIARYYEYNIANGEKAGRAAWHKKAFNGLNFESINLPGRLYLNLLWAAYERYDNYEYEYVDFSNDLAYAGDNNPLKGTGIGDAYRHCFHARLAANQLFGELTPGFNFIKYDYNDDVITSQDGNGYLFLKSLRVNSNTSRGDDFKGVDSMPTLVDSGFYKEPKVFSVDLRGPVLNRLIDLHADLAFSQVDTTFLIWDSVPSNKFTKSHRSSVFAPAFFTKAAFNTKVPFQLDIAAIAKGFCSPLSFAVPQDAFYAFNSNMVGSGKFMARGEASPYAQNMAGALLSVTPKLPGYGHMRVAYGQHAQLKPGRDILYLPYRLNGLDYFSFWHSSYSRWGNNPLMTPAFKQDGKRLGNESFISPAYQSDPLIPPLGNESGGIYTDYLSTYYCFVPYSDVNDARKNVESQSKTDPYGGISYTRGFGADTSATGFVPVHQKFTNNMELDFSYDISGLVGYPNDLFVGGFASVNNIATAFTPLAISDKGKETQLWSVYLRFEPAIAITKKFYILGILGFENWRSQMALADVPDTALSNKYLAGKMPLLSPTTKTEGGKVTTTHAYYSVPIDFRDAAFGIGFDWEILSRVGLHGRFKYMQHKDVNFSYNNWGTPVASLEIKTWF